MIIGEELFPLLTGEGKAKLAYITAKVPPTKKETKKRKESL